MVRVSGLVGRHLGVWSGFRHHVGAAGAGAGPPRAGWLEVESQEVPVVSGEDPVPQTSGVGRRHWSRPRQVPAGMGLTCPKGSA